MADIQYSKKTLFYENGQKRCEFTMKNNVYHGPYLAWHKNGVLAAFCEYSNGLLHGLVVHYNEVGEMTERVHYKKDRRNGVQELWSKGRRIHWALFNDERVIQSWHLDKNGKKVVDDCEIVYEWD